MCTEPLRVHFRQRRILRPELFGHSSPSGRIDSVARPRPKSLQPNRVGMRDFQNAFRPLTTNCRECRSRPNERAIAHLDAPPQRQDPMAGQAIRIPVSITNYTGESPKIDTGGHDRPHRMNTAVGKTRSADTAVGDPLAKRAVNTSRCLGVEVLAQYFQPHAAIVDLGLDTGDASSGGRDRSIQNQLPEKQRDRNPVVQNRVQRQGQGDSALGRHRIITATADSTAAPVVHVHRDGVTSPGFTWHNGSAARSCGSPIVARS